MKVTLSSDLPVTPEACQQATGKTFSEWFADLESQCAGKGRRDSIQWLYDQTGRGKDVWWPTTIWVEYERSKGVVNKKDGLGEGYNICVTKTIKAGAQAVYDAMAGGAMEGQPYADESGNTGTWVRLRSGKDIRLTWMTNGVKTQTTVDAAFTEKDGKTGITLLHNRIQTREEADGLRAAWGEALSQLKAMLES